MKFTVKVDGQYFDVEIDNLHTRPIIARIGSDSYEIMPIADKGMTEEERSAASLSSPVPRSGPKASPLPRKSEDEKAIFAPIPGVIEKILVTEGEAVKRGQELMILEAMKMKNAIRSPRDGQVMKIRVAVGDTVNHNDMLLEFMGDQE